MIRPNSQQETVDLVTFTEESFYGKPQFLHRFYSGYNTLFDIILSGYNTVFAVDEAFPLWTNLMQTYRRELLQDLGRIF